jgi:hypothetical protein
MVLKEFLTIALSEAHSLRIPLRDLRFSLNQNLPAPSVVLCALWGEIFPCRAQPEAQLTFPFATH